MRNPPISYADTESMLIESPDLTQNIFGRDLEEETASLKNEQFISN
ncbi:MAG: hypothetical protein ACK521_12425 [bacterium]